MTKKQGLILIVSILASLVAFMDGSVVNVALPAISLDLGGGLSAQQWIVDAYLITLGSLILIAGSLSDIYGRKVVLEYGLWGFGMTSLLCAISPNATFLIFARALQGIAGALLVPSSLALIMSAFKGKEQGQAIGRWTAWTGIAFVIGPLVGGGLVDISSWRWIFVLNVLPVAATLYLLRQIAADHAKDQATTVDDKGALLCSLGLAAVVFALIEQPHYGWGAPVIWITLVIGSLLLLAFVGYEHNYSQPMLPLGLFRSRNFTAGNIATTAVYASLSMATFLVVIFVQQVGGYSAFAAGLALLPVTIIMLFLSGRMGTLSSKYGPQIFMTAGPLIAAAGFLLMLRVGQDVQYWTRLFPAVLLFGLGLATTVAPLTSAVLGSIEPKHAGVASAINNAVARIAGLVAIAFIGLFAGGQLDEAGFHSGVFIMSILMVSGGIISALGIRNPRQAMPAVSKSPDESV